MRMKKISAILLTVLLLCNMFTLSAFASVGDALSITVLSDLHYLSPSLIADTADFRWELTEDIKMLAESQAILKAALNTVRAQAPDVLLIPGDLSCNGEKISHQEVAALLEGLKKDLPNTKVLLINGNHDIGNKHCKNYNTESGKAERLKAITAEEFMEIYSVCYTDDCVVETYSGKTGELNCSYVARIGNYTFVALDSNHNNGNVGGGYSDELLAWALAHIAAAKERDDTVVGLTHHGIVEHIASEKLLMSEYVIDNYLSVTPQLADAGLEMMFTGHCHANDIASMTTLKGHTVYDVETGSLTTYPCPIRTVKLTRASGKCTADIRTITNYSIGTFTNPATGQQQTVSDVTSYSMAVSGYSPPYLKQQASRRVSEGIDTVLSAVPQTAQWLKTNLNENMSEIIDGMVAVPVDETHTVLDLANYVFFIMRDGNNPTDYPQWVKEGINQLSSGELITKLFEVIREKAFSGIMDELRFESVYSEQAAQAVGLLAVALVESVGRDINYTEDNNTTIVLGERARNEMLRSLVIGWIKDYFSVKKCCGLPANRG